MEIEEFKGLENYLLSFGKRLEQSGEKGSRKKTSNKWFETQDTIAYWKEFSKPKIYWKRIGSILRFGYIEEEVCGLDSTCIATGSHLKYLVAFLNSKLIHFELFSSA